MPATAQFSPLLAGILLATSARVFWRPIRRPRSFRGGLTALLAGIGAFALIDGFTLAVREEARRTDGRVTSGVVEERLSSTGEGGTRTIGGRGRGTRRLAVRTTGFDAYSAGVRLLLTGTTDAWVVDYRFPCGVGRGTCHQREFVDRDLWSRLRAGSTVNVRRSGGESSSARLDENPQIRVALVKTALSCAMLALAWLVRARRTPSRHAYTKAPAVVTSIERVMYGDEARWKVRFAYFDDEGTARESIDEVNDPSWKVEDDCVAVYRPQAPDLATLQPAAGAVANAR